MNSKKLQKLYIKVLEIQSPKGGKRIGRSLYLHKTIQCSKLTEFVHVLCQKCQIEKHDVNVVRIDYSGQSISLSQYESLEEVPFPALLCSHTIHFEPFQYRKREYGKSGNPPILHRKELLLGSQHPRIEEFKQLTNQAENYGLFEHRNRIGYRSYWNALIQSKGLKLEGHRLKLI